MHTLTKVKNSKLAKFFAHPWNLKRLPDGTIFLDRDLTHFSNLLNFLRNDGMVPAFSNSVEKQMFMQELKFWEIPLPNQDQNEIAEEIKDDEPDYYEHIWSSPVYLQLKAIYDSVPHQAGTEYLATWR